MANFDACDSKQSVQKRYLFRVVNRPFSVRFETFKVKKLLFITLWPRGGGGGGGGVGGTWLTPL